MALAALIAATKDVEGPVRTLRATLPVAGQCLIEHQVRLAARAGAGHVVILVGALPSSLVAAIDRLRGDGIAVEIARDLKDAVDRIHPDESLLVMADGFVTGVPLVERIAGLPVPAILTVPDEPATAAFERIDFGERWGGLLLIDGTKLRRTAEMLGDWDLESTLLRHAVQEGAARIPMQPQDHIVIAENTTEVAGVDRALLAASAGDGADWPAAYIYPAIEGVAAPILLARGTDATVPGWVSAGMAVAGGLGMFGGWWLTGFILLLLSGPIAAIAHRIGAARLIAPRTETIISRVRHAAAAFGLVGLAWGLSHDEGWGLWALAAFLLAAMGAIQGERRIVTRLSGVRPLRWLASLDGLLWGGTPFALLGEWQIGLVALGAYAGASFFALQRDAVKRIDVPPPA